MVLTMNTHFIQAAGDLYLLLNRGYPKRPAVKLVGDRYRLDGIHRMILYRGIFDRRQAETRRAKLSVDPRRKKCRVDGYNILFSIRNYLMGRPLFVANDGFLRDSGGPLRTPGSPEKLEQSLQSLIRFLQFLRPREFTLYLDLSVPGCQNHTTVLDQKIRQAGLAGSVEPVPSADRTIGETKEGIAVTSDSEIIDRLLVPATDLLGPLRNQARPREHPLFSRPIQDLGEFLPG